MDKNKLKLTFLLLAAALPITLATWAFEKRELEGVQTTTNNGKLIIPVMDITEFGLRNDAGEELFQTFEEMVAGTPLDEYEPRPWMLMYLGSSSCDSVCADRLHFLRQLHIRLASESDRVERFFINVGGNTPINEATQTLFADEFPDLKYAKTAATALTDALARSVKEGVDPISSHYIYVVDPVGNVMLYFTPENTTEEIFKDLDKLLDQSSLG